MSSDAEMIKRAAAYELERNKRIRQLKAVLAETGTLQAAAQLQADAEGSAKPIKQRRQAVPRTMGSGEASRRSDR